MGTQQKLSERQEDILYLINALENDLIIREEDLLSDEEIPMIEKLYDEAMNSYAMGDFEVDGIVEQLQALGYLNKNVELTVDGKQYLEVGYQPEVQLNNITNNYVEQQTNINTKKYVERNAPAVQLDSAVKLSKESTNIDVGSALKGMVQGVKELSHKK